MADHPIGGRLEHRFQLCCHTGILPTDYILVNDAELSCEIRDHAGIGHVSAVHEYGIEHSRA